MYSQAFLKRVIAMKKIVSFVLSLSMIIILIPLGCITAYAEFFEASFGPYECFDENAEYINEPNLYAYASGGAVEYTSDAAIESNEEIDWFLQRISEGGIVYRLAVLTDCALTSPVHIRGEADLCIDILNNASLSISCDGNEGGISCNGQLTVSGGSLELNLDSNTGIGVSGPVVIDGNADITINLHGSNYANGINTSSKIIINSGRLEMDVVASESAYGLNAAKGIIINDGSIEMDVVASGDAYGLNIGLDPEPGIVINDGNIEMDVVASGSAYGMKSSGDISILGGDIEISSSGIEFGYALSANNMVSISGGNINLTTHSNNHLSITTYSSNIIIEGGYIEAQSVSENPDYVCEIAAVSGASIGILTVGSINKPAYLLKEAVLDDGTIIGFSCGIITGSWIGRNPENDYLVISFEDPNRVVYTYYSPTYYNINVAEDMVNGGLSSNYRSAYHGQTVTLTASPECGMCVETITVTDRNGKEIAVDNAGKNKFTFSMPGSAVTAAATFMEDNTMLNFCVDVTARDDYYDAVLWAYENNITNGTDFVHFSPFAEVSRGQAVTWLWRAAGSPEPSTLSAFSDVVPGSYCEKAAAWALEKGITNGTGGTAFSPEKICTRAEIITFLARYAGVKDAAVDTGFDDVAADSFCAAAVKWAKTNKVTDGTSENLFSPLLTCTRWQAVTFLYRHLVK